MGPLDMEYLAAKYRYLTNPQGNHMSGATYNKRFNLDKMFKQVNDSPHRPVLQAHCQVPNLARQQRDPAEPCQLQLCQKQVEWPRFRIAKDTVNPMFQSYQGLPHTCLQH